MSSEKEEEIVITLEHKSCTKKKKESRKEKAKEKKKKWLTQQNETAEIQKTKSLVHYDAENWLSIQPDNNKKLVKTMHYKICCEYKNETCG